ncbi:hypothetical protein L1049_020191 [Liquidambar formosana]|uniref:Late embryogenesis abundant protein LEA-2 subgroup domain-containing protein n=1 Tax=Liquidambar formosana TaxID=63359 RepID=A0AAP0S9H1_LIQFO
MAEKSEQQFYPLAQATTGNHVRGGGVESPTVQSKEFRRKRRIKCLAYVAAFAVFQTIIIVVFALTVMRIKNPKFRVRAITIENPTFGNATSPSFKMKFSAEITVKNTNFGHFKFENTTITFSYMGVPVGEGTIDKGRARARSTKKMNVSVDVNSDKVLGNSNLGSDISAGILRLTSHSKLSGKVHLMKVMKKKKSTVMQCEISIKWGTSTVETITCI